MWISISTKIHIQKFCSNICVQFAIFQQTVCLLYKSKENIFFAKQKMYCLSPFIYRDSCRATIGDYVKLYLFLLELFFLIHYFFPFKKDEEETTFVIRCILSITWPLGPRVKNNRENEN